MITLSQFTLPRVIKAHWKRILLALIVVTVTVALGVYFAIFHVYKSNYQHTLRQVNQAITSYNTLLSARDTAIAQIGASDKSFSDSMATYKQEYDTYDANVRAISSERSLRDDMVNASYDQLVKKNDKFDLFIASQFDILHLVHRVTIDCSDTSLNKLNTSDLGKLVSVYDTATTACVAGMQSLSKSKDSDAAKTGLEAVNYFAGMRKHVVAMQDAYTAGNRSTFESEYNAFLEEVANYKPRTQVSDLLSIDKSLVPTTELNQLAVVVNARQK